jgi:hypothetical protein
MSGIIIGSPKHNHTLEDTHPTVEHPYTSVVETKHTRTTCIVAMGPSDEDLEGEKTVA